MKALRLMEQQCTNSRENEAPRWPIEYPLALTQVRGRDLQLHDIHGIWISSMPIYGPVQRPKGSLV